MFTSNKVLSLSYRFLALRTTIMQYERCTACVHTKMHFDKQNIKKIFLKSLEEINTKKLIKSAVQITDNKLKICDRHYELNSKCYLVGFGKAVLNMAIEIEGILGANLVRGICSIPSGILSTSANRQMAEKSKIKFIQGAKNNLPDIDAENAAREIFGLVSNLEKGDLIIVLISGGGSALLPLPTPPVTLDDKTLLIKALAKNGADINELNCVRKRLSVLKGGGLARFVYPANIVSLILSDVIGDPIDIIASGPTIPNKDNPNDAMDVIKKFGLQGSISKGIKTVLTSPMPDESTDVPYTPIGTYVNVENYLIGTNKLAAEAAKAYAIKLGYQTVILSLGVSGEVSKLSLAYAKLSSDIAELMKNLSTKEYLEMLLQNLQPTLNLSEEGIQELLSLNFDTDEGICIILAGEPTITVKGRGKGGRNQHLALQFSVDIAARMQTSAVHINDMFITFLSCGTDGIDGPTDAAGAIGTNKLYDLAIDQEFRPERFLRSSNSNDFYTKFEDGTYLIKTGHTGTNVMDLHIMIINKGYVYESEENMSHLSLLQLSSKQRC